MENREVSDEEREAVHFRSAHHLFTTINLHQTHRLRECMKTTSKRCFMAIQLQEGCLTAIWICHKVQWVTPNLPNLNLRRKRFAE